MADAFQTSLAAALAVGLVGHIGLEVAFQRVLISHDRAALCGVCVCQFLVMEMLTPVLSMRAKRAFGRAYWRKTMTRLVNGRVEKLQEQQLCNTTFQTARDLYFLYTNLVGMSVTAAPVLVVLVVSILTCVPLRGIAFWSLPAAFVTWKALRIVFPPEKPYRLEEWMAHHRATDVAVDTLGEAAVHGRGSANAASVCDAQNALFRMDASEDKTIRHEVLRVATCMGVLLWPALQVADPMQFVRWSQLALSVVLQLGNLRMYLTQVQRHRATLSSVHARLGTEPRYVPATPPRTAVLTLSHVAVRRGPFSLRMQHELKLAPGAVILVTGGSNAGKTSFFNALAGMYSSADASMNLFLGGEWLASPKALRGQFVYVQQSQSNDGEATALENVLRGNEAARDTDAVRTITRATRCDAFLNRTFSALSGGEVTRASVARGVLRAVMLLKAKKLRFVILDEIDRGLDLELATQVVRDVVALFQKARVPVLVSTHLPQLHAETWWTECLNVRDGTVTRGQLL